MTHPLPRDAREVRESPLIQGTWERRAYEFDFTDCGVTTIEDKSVAVTAGGVDVTNTVISGGPSVAGLVVTTPPLANVQVGTVYHLYARVIHDGGQKTELYVRVLGRA